MSTESLHSGSDDFEVRETLRLPDSERASLSQQYGPILEEIAIPAIAANHTVIAIGDMVCITLLSINVLPKVMVFDLKTQRGQVPASWRDKLLSSPGRLTVVRNDSATISPELWSALKEAWLSAGTTRILVEGEEDMAGLAAIYLMRGAAVFYGLPGRGATYVVSDERARAQALTLLKKMEPALRQSDD